MAIPQATTAVLQYLKKSKNSTPQSQTVYKIGEKIAQIVRDVG
jgi:uroporphyrinogen-III synthase